MKKLFFYSLMFVMILGGFKVVKADEQWYFKKWELDKKYEITKIAFSETADKYIAIGKEYDCGDSTCNVYYVDYKMNVTKANKYNSGINADNYFPKEIDIYQLRAEDGKLVVSVMHEGLYDSEKDYEENSVKVVKTFDDYDYGDYRGYECTSYCIVEVTRDERSYVGLMSAKGEWILEPNYGNLNSFGLIDLAGENIIVPVGNNKYDEIDFNRPTQDDQDNPLSEYNITLENFENSGIHGFWVYNSTDRNYYKITNDEGTTIFFTKDLNSVYVNNISKFTTLKTSDIILNDDVPYIFECNDEYCTTDGNLYDWNGNKVLSAVSVVEPIGNGLFAVQKNGKFIITDLKRNIVEESIEDIYLNDIKNTKDKVLFGKYVDNDDDRLPLITNYYLFINYNNLSLDEQENSFEFKANGPFSLFDSLLINGKIVPSSMYFVKEGSTIISLSDDYINTLADGKYTIQFMYDEEIKTPIQTFEVNNSSASKQKIGNPKTLDSVVYMFGLLAASVGGVYIVCSKIKKSGEND